MAKPWRFAPADVPSHVYCRGNQQQDIFSDDHDRRRYMDLLTRHAAESGVRILGYCEMTNHTHLILLPSTDTGLSRMMCRLNSEYATAIQFKNSRSGNLWQHHFGSAPMDHTYLWNALRYIELNPVRAGMVKRPEDWPWSSAASHLGSVSRPSWLDRRLWEESWDIPSWREFLLEDVTPEESGEIRRATRERRPLAAADTIRRWELSYGTTLLPAAPGRPAKLALPACR